MRRVLSRLMQSKASRLLGRLHRDEGGAQMVEYALIFAAIGIPLYFIFAMLLDWLSADYGMVVFLNGWPFP